MATLSGGTIVGRQGFVAGLRLAAVAGLVWVGLLVWAGSASAVLFVDSFMGNPTGAGSTGGLLNEPRGVAVNNSTGATYVADTRNNRVQQFNATNEFVRAWGQDVIVTGQPNDTGPGFEVCDTTAAIPNVAADCKAGVPGSEGGMVSFSTGGSCNAFNPCAGGVAVNQATGDVYVTDSRNLRVQQFTAAGQFVRAWGQDVIVTGQPNDTGAGFEVCDTTAVTPNVPADCKIGVAGTTGGAFATVFDGHLAVAPASAPNAGNVVVADPGNRRVQEFTATGGFVRAFGADVAAPAGDTAFEICTTIADCQAGLAGSGPGMAAGRFGNQQPKSVAVDTTGAIYATEPTFAGGNFRMQKFTPQPGPPALAPEVFAPDALSDVGDGRSPISVAVNPVTNRVFVIKGSAPGASTCVNGSPSESSEQRLLELSTDGVLLSTSLACARFTSFRPIFSLALRPSTGEAFVSSWHAINPNTGADGPAAHRVYVLDADGITPAIASINPATAVTDTSAQLSGTVNPNSVDNIFAPTAWRIQYSRDGVSWQTAAQGTLPAGTSPVVVSGTATGLLPNTTYRTRILTQKPFVNAEIASAELTLLTDAVPPELSGVAADSITETSARLTGQVNAHSTLTSYRFEWGLSDGPLDRVVPLPDGSVGSGPQAVFVSEQLTGLQPGTGYRFRLVATSATEGQTSSAIETFTTPSTPPTGLGRAYELVSPADKFGGTGVGEWYRGIGSMGHSGVAAHEGERFAAQGSFGSVLLSDPAFSFANDWALAERVDGQLGWRSHSPLTHPSNRGALASFMTLRGASSDLSWLKWDANSTPAFFPGLEQGPDIGANRPGWSNNSAGFLSDWGSPPLSPTRWELFGPDSLSLLANNSMIDPAEFAGMWDVKYSDDGSFAVGLTNLDNQGVPRLPLAAGLAGPGDPSFPDWSTLDLGGLDSGRLIYRADLSGGLSDQLEIGDRELVNVCTGQAGVDRTQLPAVDAGAVAGLDCPAPLAGDDDRLVSPLGATLKTADTGSGSVAGTVSSDGSRTFFMSPDPLATGAPNGTSAFCSGSGEATVCPPQLYVRQDIGGESTVRWISKAADGLLGNQAPELTGAVRFEGASADGRRVFFRTNSPLTADDPNGVKDSGNIVAPPPGGITTGTASNDSWDLYMYELPTDPGADIGDGQLTRVSAGPDGLGDCNSPLRASAAGDDGSVGALRFASTDGSRAYFTCAAPLPGVPAPANGTITTPGGDHTTTTQTNLYLHDLTKPADQRWRFIARLPRATADSIDICASTGTIPRSPFNARSQDADLLLTGVTDSNCVRGSEDGGFVTFMSMGRLTADDPPAPASGDVYGYDLDSNRLTRISAAQGGVGGAYPCATNAATPVCHGDGGIDQQGSVVSVGTVNAALGVATRPLADGDRIAFFQSRSRLVAEDTDGGYDVYQWRNGDLSLISTGASGTDGAIYRGNDATGRNVYFVTRDQLSWQDHDDVADVYTARVGGGIAQPPPAPACDVLAHACRGGGAAPLVAVSESQRPGGENAVPGVRVGEKRLSVDRMGAKARRAAARRGVLRLAVKTSAAGRVSATATARLRTSGGKTRARRVASGSVRAEGAGRVVVVLRLSKQARRHLNAGRGLVVRVGVRLAGAESRSMTVRLPGAGS